MPILDNTFASGDLPRREFLKRSVASAAAVATGGVVSRAIGQPQSTDGIQSPTRKPNLLFVFSDQQSYDMLGCNGNRDILTHRTDAFAEQGVRFTHCFSNAPVCTPYRGMLMSGKHPLHNGAFENDLPLCPSAGPHFGDVLEAQGYRTGYIGKWHLLGGNRDRPVPAGPLRAGFDDTFYTDNCTTEYRAGHSFYYDSQGEKQIYDAWQPYGQTDQAVAFLNDAAADDQPFALFVSWHPPHDHGRLPAPPDPHYNYTHVPPELVERYGSQHLALRPGVEDSPARQDQLRHYYAMCSGIDHAFGRLLDALEAHGLDDNTLVVFTSDHGDTLGSHNCPKPKRPPHDTSARVPLIIRYPQALPAERTSELLISGLDLMPTLLGLMEISPPLGVHGQNLASAIKAGNDDAVDSIPMLMISWPVFRGVITRDWTFGMGKPGQRNDFNSVLFDRHKDPHQLNNLFDDDAHRAVHEQMEALTRKWMERFEDPFVTIQELAQIQPWEAWREPPGDPNDWPVPIDVLHGRAKPLVPVNTRSAADEGPLGWSAGKQLELSLTEAGLMLRCTGNDPILLSPEVDVAAGPMVVAMRLRSSVGGSGQWFWSTGGAFSVKQSVEFEVQPQADWLDTRVPLPVQGKLKKLRFDPLRSPGEVGVQWIELQDVDGRTQQRWTFQTPEGAQAQ